VWSALALTTSVLSGLSDAINTPHLVGPEYQRIPRPALIFPSSTSIRAIPKSSSALTAVPGYSAHHSGSSAGGT
jgi:hypothetical protein